MRDKFLKEHADQEKLQGGQSGVTDEKLSSTIQLTLKRIELLDQVSFLFTPSPLSIYVALALFIYSYEFISHFLFVPFYSDLMNLMFHFGSRNSICCTTR